ncbi:Lovastatin nonaketide synthase [Fusarium oxysporum f. sp. cubense race 1]|uniref:Lovastatin nonaketide synthase n=1 Tax=Fusarium oxysporum f. sp. cubense (strain race 1) TaxID=1229664 RepID=N4V482_FUSC1|nr:Lovastatin nonaketide synthase [Fusarium oxysporum f. sp. cubense race 1]
MSRTISPPTPIAIIGVGCRLPGGANNLDKLWELLSEGRNGQTEIPKDRWNADSWFDAYPDAKQSMVTKHGYFLHDDISQFDAKFFGISSAEAHSMDPQQRLFLMTTYEALEDAGIPVETLRGSNTGVYASIFERSYDRMGHKDLSTIGRTHLNGTGESILSNRISYCFDLRGPCMTIDTGCSGSLVGLHQACHSLRLGESNLALVGGSQLVIQPDVLSIMSGMGMLNPDGKSYAFDSRGAGYGRGEGVATIVLKRLDHALKDGDRVHAIIANSGMNQDGKTPGLNTPSSEAQAALSLRVYQEAGLNPADTSFVEAHGTGTQAGDREEIASISKVFCEGSGRRDDLYVGSVKTNIGHLEATSGIAGLLKSILVLKHSQIPANLNFIKPKPSLKLYEKKIKIPSELTKLPTPQHNGPARVSVNSFGYGGTNCHVILEDPATNGSINTHLASPNGSSISTDVTTVIDSTPQLFVVSASTEKALLSTLENTKQWAKTHLLNPQTLRSLSYTLGVRKSVLSFRRAIVASTCMELLEELDQMVHPKRATTLAPLTFVFSGQGAQWHAMGRELINSSLCFRQSMMAMESTILSEGGSWSLIDELLKAESESRIGEAEISQPATTAIQIALVDLLESLSIRPSRVVGHSSGEVAAAYAAGALSRDNAIIVAYHRGIASSNAKAAAEVPGSMMAVSLGEAEAQRYIDRVTTGIVSVACVNSPESSTISGDLAAIEELKSLLDAEGIFARKLKVDTAYHSHHMRRIAQDYHKAMQNIESSDVRSDVAFYSSVTGTTKSAAFGADYWSENLVSQVKFSQALALLRDDQLRNEPGMDTSVFIEIGPHSALAGPSLEGFTLYPGAGYLTMAIEAMKQLVQLRDVKQPISRFILRDVVISKSIVLNESDNDEQSGEVEVQLSMSTSRQYEGSRWETFRIWSYDNANGSWTENCCGEITVEYESNEDDEVNGTRETDLRREESMQLLNDARQSCNMEMTKAEFYEFAKLTGNQWDGAFSPIDSLKYGNKKGLLDIIVPDVASLMPYRSFRPHIIHPITLDAVHQLSGMLFKKFVSNAPCVPTKITLLEIDAKVSSRAGDSLTAAMQIEPDGPKASTGQSWVFQEETDGQLRPVIKLLVNLRAIGEAHQDENRPFVQDKVNRLEWNLDADFMTEASGDYEAAVAYLQLLTFKNPRLRFLEIGAGTGGCTKRLLGGIAGRNSGGGLPIGQYTYTDISSGFFEEARSTFADWESYMDFKTLDVEGDPLAQGFQPESYDVIVASNVLHATKRMDATMEHVRKLLRPGGSLILVENSPKGAVIEQWDTILSRKGFGGIHVARNSMMVSKAVAPLTNGHSTGNNRIVLIENAADDGIVEISKYIKSTSTDFQISKCTWDRLDISEDTLYLVVDRAETPLLLDPQPQLFTTLNALLASKAKILWVVIQDTPDPVSTAYKGVVNAFIRVLRRESGNTGFVTLDIRDPAPSPEVAGNAVAGVLQKCFWPGTHDGKSLEPEIAYENGRLLIPRVLPDATFLKWARSSWNDSTMTQTETALHQGDRALRLEVATPGLLSSLRFVDGDLLPELGADQIEVKPDAYGVNYRDLCVALGQMNSDAQMVGEFAGIVTAVGPDMRDSFQVGDRVMGFGAQPYSNLSRVNGYHAHKTPNWMSNTTAASIPYAYVTAYQSIRNLANLEKGQSVLIHSASGAVGQAAIQLAQSIGAEIFCTVGNREKRQFLMETYGIPESHIYSSRSGSVKQSIMRLTGGEGVDLVLSTLTGEMLRESLDCVKSLGVFIDLVKTEMQKASLLSMAAFEKSITFHAFDLITLATRKADQIHRVFGEIVKLIGSGALCPMEPAKVYPIEQVEDAFRLVSARKHIGKVVLVTQLTSRVKCLPAQPTPLRLRKDGTYIVAGVRGVVQGALALRDRTFSQMTVDEWKQPLQPKIVGTINLDKYFASPDLAFFVALSSIVSVIGKSGQSNYAAGNGFQDAFARAHANHPHTQYVSLNIGAVSIDAHGALEASQNETTISTIRASLRQNSVMDISFDEFFANFEYLMTDLAKKDGLHQSIQGVTRLSMMEANDEYLLDNPIFNQLQHTLEQKTTGAAKSDKIDFAEALAGVKTMVEAEQLIQDAALAKFAVFLDRPIEEIRVDQSLATIGLDSLVSIELKNWMVRTFQVNLQTSELSGAGSITALTATVASRSKLIPDEIRQSGPKEIGTATEESSLSTGEQAQTNHGFYCCRTCKELPRYPLVDLDEAVKDLLNSVGHFAHTREEYTELSRKAHALAAPDSLGRRLYNKLRAQADDPNVESWIADLLLKALHLKRRYPLAPFGNFLGTHFDSPTVHTQAERAAILTTALYEFKADRDAGRLEPDFLGTRANCGHSLSWLFNAVREPNVDCDKMMKYPDNEYVAVLRRGRLFKVPLKQAETTVSYDMLKATYQAIVDLDLEDRSWAGMLTTDNRDSWGLNRQRLLSLDSRNSVFVLCLDDNSPITRADRVRSGYIGDSFNRWHDKCTQIIVTANGRSATIFEHSMIDLMTVSQLSQRLQNAITTLDPGNAAASDGTIAVDSASLKEIPLVTTEDIDSRIETLRQDYLAITSTKQYVPHRINSFGKTLLLSHSAPIKATVDLTIQLASRLYFGYLPASWETVSTAHFHLGRPEIVQVVLKSVMDFCDAALDDAVPRSEARARLLQAARECNAQIAKGTEGRNYFRLMDVIEVMAQDQTDEKVPEMFSDPVWKRGYPQLIMQTMVETKLAEDPGFTMPHPESVWMNYTVFDDSVEVCFVSPVKSAERFGAALDRAAELVKDIISARDI